MLRKLIERITKIGDRPRLVPGTTTINGIDAEAFEAEIATGTG